MTTPQSPTPETAPQPPSTPAPATTSAVTPAAPATPTTATISPPPSRPAAATVPIRCPIITNPDVGLAPPEDFDPLIARLRDASARPAGTAAGTVGTAAGTVGTAAGTVGTAAGTVGFETFPRGIVRDDGRLDLCKQGVGPAQAARIVAAAADSPLVRHLLLGTNGLGTEGSRAVADALRPGHGIETLYLGCNKIGPAGTEALAERLADDDTVRALWLKRNPVGDEGVARLAAALSHNRAIRTLDLVNTGMSVAGLTVLAETLAAGGPRLQRLYLGGNGFGPEAVPALTILIHDAGIRELYLAANHLGDEGAIALAATAGGVPMTLGLGGNGLTATGVAALARHCGQWTALDLARPPSERALGANGNLVGDDGAAALADALPRARLRRLDLRRTGIGGRGAARLVAAIADGHPTLEYLGLSGGVPRRLRQKITALLADHPESGAHADVRAITSVYR